MQNVKPQQPQYKNPYERAQASDGASIARDIEAQRAKMEAMLAQEKAQESSHIANPEFTQTVFDLSTHKESVEKPKQIQEIQQLVETIRQEVKNIKAQSEGLTAEIAQIEKAALQSLPDKVGVYHVRYLEIILSFLEGLKAKVGEARTWLAAMQSKKAKRGSAFAANTKKKGTQYSQSQELSSARNVQ
jgi:septum formation inhibitor MinC